MNTEACKNLANAIIITAANDYRTALRRLKRNPNSEAAKRVISKTERFFRSDWYGVLTDVDGEYLIRRIREEVGI